MEQALGILFAIAVVGGISYFVYTKTWKKKQAPPPVPPPSVGIGPAG